MRLPTSRGPLSSLVAAWLTGEAVPDPPAALALISPGDGRPPMVGRAAGVLGDDDCQIALWMLYELHYGGFDEVDDGWEWSPECLVVRRTLERLFEREVRRATAQRILPGCDSKGSLADRLFELVAKDDGPSLSRFIQRRADRTQALEMLVLRSVYNLKEADPHTWVVPRLTGPPKVALVELQFDEYGAGQPGQLHAQLYADTMTACGLDPQYGAYIDAVPASTLSVNNLMSLFGLHRRLRGAAMGHLAAFEATSSLPSRRVSNGLQRLQFPRTATSYFDEHVVADAVHEQLAARSICEVLVQRGEVSESDVVFGALACLEVDRRAAQDTLDSWASGRSALRAPLAEPLAVGA
jgi:hypothetical protein